MNLMASHEFGPFSKSRRNLVEKNLTIVQDTPIKT